MIHTIRLYIEKYRLLSEDRPVLVGLSGGADSVALLGVLVRLGYPCIALHCNFHLRGEESDRDEAFACEFAESLEVPFHKIDFDTISYAGEKHLSIEMAARELRYAWFEEMRERLGGQATAVAHHRDDNVETVLMNLIRGTGIRGMSGSLVEIILIGVEDILYSGVHLQGCGLEDREVVRQLQVQVEEITSLLLTILGNVTRQVLHQHAARIGSRQ